MPLQLLSFEKVPFWQYEYFPPALAWMTSRIVVKEHSDKTTRLQKLLLEKTGARVNLWFGLTVDRAFIAKEDNELRFNQGKDVTFYHLGLMYSNGCVCFRMGYTGLKFRRFYRRKWKVAIAKQKRAHENQVRAFILSQLSRNDAAILAKYTPAVIRWLWNATI